MKINTLKNAIRLATEAGRCPFVWGHRGLGKSSVLQQVCIEDQIGFIDFRCSQIEASDVRGLPDRSDGRTVYLPPADMPVADMEYEEYERIMQEASEEERFVLETQLQPRLKRGILFLDEINRAQDDVLQAVFQLVLDRRVGQYVLPPGWVVVCAGNYNEGDYMTNGFTDSAFLDRFCHLIFSGGEATLEEWVAYMANRHGGAATDVIEFASQNIKHLDGDVSGELGFKIQPSRRSWEGVIIVEQICQLNGGRYGDDARREVLAGLVGREMAIAYDKYSCPVKPTDLVANGVKAMEDKLASLSRPQLSGVMWGLVSHVKPNIHKEKEAECALDFAEFICAKHREKDLVVAFCKALMSGNGTGAADNIRNASISNPNVAHLLQKVAARKGGKKGNGKKTFLDRLNERPDLQKLLSKTAWGSN